jgi:hypothetical protein
MFLLVKLYKFEVYEKCQNISIQSFIKIMMDSHKEIQVQHKKGKSLKKIIYQLFIKVGIYILKSVTQL